MQVYPSASLSFSLKIKDGAAANNAYKHVYTNYSSKVMGSLRFFFKKESNPTSTH